jgi:DNA-binding Lrp family transcriptional regulator
MDEILEILEKDARTSIEDIACMINKSASYVKKKISEYEKKGIIIKYKTIINKEQLSHQDIPVRALIEVKVSPQRGVGFDAVAERIFRFPEVTSCYLLSGGYDLFVNVEGKDLHQVSNFVSEKLATLDHVQGTVTHFILKKYKENGDILHIQKENKRLSITP